MMIVIWESNIFIVQATDAKGSDWTRTLDLKMIWDLFYHFAIPAGQFPQINRKLDRLIMLEIWRYHANLSNFTPKFLCRNMS
jgi:hypothetical protein